MTNKEFISRLEIIASMGDNQVKTLAELLIDYFSEKKQIDGFAAKGEEK